MPNRPAAPDGDLVRARDAALYAITRVRREQTRLEEQAGRMAARSARLDQALDGQRRLLADTISQIADAERTVRAAAEHASTAEPATLPQYLGTADGLQTQREVVEVALTDLDRMRADTEQSGEQAAALIRSSRIALDRALREEVALLGRVEALIRHQRLHGAPGWHAEPRLQGDPPGDPGGPAGGHEQPGPTD